MEIGTSPSFHFQVLSVEVHRLAKGVQNSYPRMLVMR